MARFHLLWVIFSVHIRYRTSQLIRNSFVNSLPLLLPLYPSSHINMYLYLWLTALLGIFIHTGSLTKLAELVLFDNSLTGSIPSTLGSLSSLTYMALSGNKLVEIIPSSLGMNLVLYSSFHNGRLIKTLLITGSLSKLRGMYLHTNSLSGVIPSTLGNICV